MGTNPAPLPTAYYPLPAAKRHTPPLVNQHYRLRNGIPILIDVDRDPAKPKKSRLWLWLILIVAAGGAAVYFGPRVTQAVVQDKTKQTAKGNAGNAPRSVPVVAMAAHKGDMPVYLNGLGSVTAFNTVTVRSRVDGQLIKVAFQEGQFVKEGDLLAEIDPRPYQVQLQQAEGQLARDQAMLNNANVDLERYRVLFAQDSIPKQQLDTQESQVRQFGATIKTDEAQINNAKLNLTYSIITAPLTGRIGLRTVDQGNMIHASDANGLAVIVQLQPIAVVFNIAQDSLPQVTGKVNAGQKLPVFAYDRDLKQKLAAGTLLTIDNQIDPATGTVKFKGSFENKDLSLFPNQFVNARLLVDTKRNAVIIPTAAIQRSPQSTFVYVVKEDSTVEVRNIVVGLTEGDDAVVDSGVTAGEVVVVDGIDKLQQGAKVTVRMAGPAHKG
jgi:multidrug efflux system membrane fusion protein